MLSVPVVLIVFNRPELTRRNLDVIRKVQPSTLLVIADGPRADHPEDAEHCAAVRRELEAIDWPVDLRLRLSEKNLGCEANIELGLDWAFEQVDRAIILEDDCLADPSFFDYAEELLERYQDDDRVWHIAGNSHWVEPGSFRNRSYAFSTWASVWGWATWSRAWQRHRKEFPRDHAESAGSWAVAPAVRVGDGQPAPGSMATEAARRHFERVATSYDGNAYGWDSHWWVTVISHGGLSATPALNLVTNDGYAEGATHTRTNRRPTPTEPVAFPLVHPEVELDLRVERELELILLRSNSRLARAGRVIIRPMWMRTIVRAVLFNRVVWGAVRASAAAVGHVRARLRRHPQRTS